MTWNERLLQTLEKTGWSKAKLSRDSGVTYGSLVKYLDGSTKQPRGNELQKLANVLGVELLWLEKGITPTKTTVPLSGDIGAGQEILAIENGGNERAPAPFEVTENTRAVRVSGLSMFPAYEEGTLIYYSQNLPPADLVNRRCIVKLADERIFVKILSPGSDSTVWNLNSINTEVPAMIDMVVDWVAPIDWIKPR